MSTPGISNLGGATAKKRGQGWTKQARPSVHAFIVVEVPLWLKNTLLEQGWETDGDGSLSLEGDLPLEVFGDLLAKANMHKLSMLDGEDESSDSDNSQKQNEHESYSSDLSERSKKKRKLGDEEQKETQDTDVMDV